MRSLILFIDPASKSTGWALFDADGVLKESGTIVAEESSDVFTRLSDLYSQYYQLRVCRKIREVHIEQLVRNTHIYTHWSVGVIGAALRQFTDTEVYADISISSWQKFAEWKGEREPLAADVFEVDSEDELAARAMGRFWFAERKNDDTRKTRKGK